MTLLRSCAFAVALVSSSLLSSCGGTPASTTSTPATTTNAYALAYQKVTWASGVTVTFPSACSMTVSSTGVPPSHNTYYLGPVATGGTVVATTPSGLQLGLNAYSGGLSTVNKVSATFNICPAKATSTTTTGGGSIGVITSGEVLFNAYEATATVALSDNVSYTFSSNGTTYTASFIDACNSHAAISPNASASTWHYHGNPTCWTPTVDGSTGPSHIIGVALDGFPIYGGRDINGAVVDATTLDACNGITSTTPEFPTTAMYHYVLPITASGTALATKQSSIGCYAGTPAATISAQLRIGCAMPMQLANGKMRLPDGREVSPAEADVWMRKTMPGMQMATTQPTPARRQPASLRDRAS